MATMLNYIKKALTVPSGIQDVYRDIIHFEARIGGTLFGPVPPKHRREFFCLDEHTWVWHEEWTDSLGRRQSVTTRYEVRPHGIIKVQGNMPHRRLSDEELQNFYQAVRLYGKKVGGELQRLMDAHPAP